MTDYSRRKSTLRQALSSTLLSSIFGNRVEKLSGRYRFRAAVRRVIEYADWIGGEISRIDDVAANVKQAKRNKKTTDYELTVKDRSILFLPSYDRTDDDVEYARLLMINVKAFRKYPNELVKRLAAVCGYQYLKAGRTVIRQGHRPTRLYCVVQGELDIFMDDGNTEQKHAGVLKSGDMFGQIALLHRVPRRATVVTKTAVDLMVIDQSAFDDVLRGHLTEEWDVLRDAFVNFNYFKGWNDDTMRECCVLSKIVDYQPNEVLLGDGKGMVHYVYFLLSGECRLIEHMLVDKDVNDKRNDTRRYKLYEDRRPYDDDNDDNTKATRKSATSKKRYALNVSSGDDLQTLMKKNLTRIQSDDSILTADTTNNKPTTDDDYVKTLMSKKSANAQIAMDRISVITVTLQDVINQWHEITDAVEMLMKRPSVTSLRKYPDNVKTVFMQICIFYRGACFGLGEQMKNRRIVSITSVKCLLIPRYWLTTHNRANIWDRVKSFLDSKYPTNRELLDKYTNDKLWTRYKKQYVRELVERGRKIPNDTKYYDVPYSMRINESTESD